MKKINTHVSSIETLTIPRGGGDPVTYDLCAVIMHDGDDKGGHYVCAMNVACDELNAAASKWFLFDDSKVTPLRGHDSAPISDCMVLGKKPIGILAYILVFRLRQRKKKQETSSVSSG